jgi:hypothetical protein
MITAVSSETAPAEPPNPLDRTGKRKPPGPIKTAQEIQDFLLRHIRNEKLDAKSCASCACAWDKMAERIRILKMEPKPRDMEVKPKASRRRGAPIATLDEMEKGQGYLNG